MPHALHSQRYGGAARRRAWSQATTADPSRRGEQRSERWTRDAPHTHRRRGSTNAQAKTRAGGAARLVRAVADPAAARCRETLDEGAPDPLGHAARQENSATDPAPRAAAHSVTRTARSAGPCRRATAASASTAAPRGGNAGGQHMRTSSTSSTRVISARSACASSTGRRRFCPMINAGCSSTPPEGTVAPAGQAPVVDVTQPCPRSAARASSRNRLSRRRPRGEDRAAAARQPFAGLAGAGRGDGAGLRARHGVARGLPPGRDARVAHRMPQRL